MGNTFDVLNSSLASTLRLWRGTNARGSVEQPAKHLKLYEFEACPYCRLVREALTELDIVALIYPTPHGGKRFRPKVAELGGKQQFPFLVDPDSGESMYESADIIDYLYRTYGGRPAPSRLLRRFLAALGQRPQLFWRQYAGEQTRNPQPEDRPEPVAHASPAGSTPASPRRRRVAAPDQKTPGVCGR